MLRDWGFNLLGQEILSINVAAYVPRDETETTPLALQVVTGLSEDYAIILAPDGESLRIGKMIPPADMQEDGEIVVGDYPALLGEMPLIGKIVTLFAVYELYSKDIGIEIGTDGGETLYVVNNGDDMLVSLTSEPQILKEESVRRITSP
jgi:hypothetical protein